MDTFSAADAMMGMKPVKLALPTGKQSQHQGKTGVIVGLHTPWRGLQEKELHVDIRWDDGMKSRHRKGRVELV